MKKLDKKLVLIGIRKKGDKRFRLKSVNQNKEGNTKSYLVERY